jgi:aryl-alcohol dehydrogenase-like predicted oxidoreductase
MRAADRARLGTTALEVTPFGFGSAPIGGLYDAVAAETAIETIEAHAPEPRYDYTRAAPDVVERALRIDAVCSADGVPLKAAAIQFPCGHPAVVSVVVGSRTVEEAAENARLFEQPIANDLWLELKHEGLLPEDAPVPGDAT